MAPTTNIQRMPKGASACRSRASERGVGANRSSETGATPRGVRGFTMLEMLAVVGIIVALAGVAFVAIWQTQMSMRQAEFDGKAKEIYMAAQNHLALAQSQGQLETLGKTGTLGIPEASSDNIYYLIYPVPDNPDNRQDALSLMLPFGSIDETIRKGSDCSYVVRYQPKSGSIVSVFYVEDATFDAADYENLLAVLPEAGNDHKADRQAFDFNGGPNNAIIGYYGGEEDGNAKAAKLKAPQLTVENGDKLVAKVTNPDYNNTQIQKNNETYGTSAQLQLRLIVKGKESGAELWVPLTTNAHNECEVVLDDVTANSGRFYRFVASQPKARKSQAKTFIPGEDLVITAWASSTGRAIVAKSASKTTNSLFATGQRVRNLEEQQISGQAMDLFASSTFDTYNFTATITSFRHLANLSPDVSHFGSSTILGGTSEYDEVSATQMADLSWPAFKESVGAGDSTAIYADGLTNPSEGNFLPLSPNYNLTYDGGGHKVAGTTISHNESAGLFGAIVKASTIKNLELVDFSVTTSSGDAGALVGTVSAESSVIANVFAHNSAGGTDVTVQGTASAGGLVGSVTGGTVQECAASLIVSATAGDAGGLIGKASGGAVKNSYSGGHTVGGAYGSSYNVTASGAAGGLIGSITNTSIVNCYSTCSVTGATAGGFLGSATGGNSSTSNCYATGKVSDGGSAFVGAAAGSINGQYIGLINPGMAGGGNSTAVEEDANWAASTSAFTEFASGARAAAPYDSTAIAGYGTSLSVAYQGKYPFKTIVELAAGTDNPVNTDDKTKLLTHVAAHFGDWPSPEVLVVNPS